MDKSKVPRFLDHPVYILCPEKSNLLDIVQ